MASPNFPSSPSPPPPPRTVPYRIVQKQGKLIINKISYATMAAQPQTKMVSVTVKYFKPGTQPPIYIAGSFSQPEWQLQEMEYTIQGDNEYEFYKNVEVEEGKEYQYKFRIGSGDWWILDEDSPAVTDNLGNRNNLLAAPAHEETIVEEKKPEHKEAIDSSMAPAQEVEDSRLPATPERTASPPIEKMNGATHVQQSKQTMEPQPDVMEAPNGSTGTQTKDPVPAYPEPAKEGNDPVETKSIKDAADTPEDEARDEKTQSPTLVIEKTDLEPRHGDDFCADSTVGQKDAHHLRAQDAEPNFVVVRNEARTPELADVAAEVADSAATLDRDEPTPPISDEEAGRVGFRRMSSTPIPEVAKTAAEVADTAALLDEASVLKENSYHDTPPKQTPIITAGNLTEVTNTPNSQTTPKEELGPEPPSSRDGEAVVEIPKQIVEPKVEVQEVQLDSGDGEQESQPQFPAEPQGSSIEKAEVQVEPSSETEKASIDTHKDEKIQVPVELSKPEHANHSLDGICPEGSHTVPSPISPFVVGNRQLGDDEHVRGISTGGDGPNITVQPATPGSSTRNGLGDGSTWGEPFKKPIDTARSSAIANENGRSQVTSRKSQRPPTPSPPDRPITPTSMRSSHKDVKSRNFLKAFWRVVFVDWIGGLILRLCGGGRRTLLAISVLAVLAPALYLFYS